ncbi:MAG: glycosyltransferase family 4 protein [Reichenbachiella sp.]|uniref:glycosyltransferase family 4 protein n=1 Tax=Reichenbachiella sp. TaxID=2184521 RepID=UPI0032990EFD
MKVLYIHQYFKRPEEGGSLRSYYLAKELVNNGFSVTMITAHSQTQRVRKVVDGIEVIYLPVPYRNEMNFQKRGRAFIKFMLLAIKESVQQRSVNFCYVMTTPLSTGVVALFNKFMLGRAYIFEVGDLWPKVPIEMGLLKARWKQKVLTWLESVFYKNAKGLIGLSEPIKEHLQLVAPKIPTQTVFNISDCQAFVPAPKKASWVAQYEVKDQFVISYTGTFGLANNLSQLVDFAKEVQHLPIKFILVGDGAEKVLVHKRVDKSGLRNIQILDAMNKDQVVEVINVSDALAVSFALYESLHTGSPNKFFDALAAGKLVITNFGGWIGELIEKRQCGFSANSPQDFAQKIQPFLEQPELLQKFQSNARRLAEEKFELKIQAKKQQDFILQLFS